MSLGRRRPRGVTLKTPEQVQLMRAAGLVVARELERVQAAVAPGVTTAQLDALAEQSIRSESAVPSFLGYHGFPASICASAGAEVVHGIPGDRPLQDGELLSVDCGAILQGWHGDAAITVPVGECAPELLELSRVTEQALWAGLATVRTGGRLSDVGHAVETVVRPHGYGLLEDYMGHGIGTAMHEPPEVLNHRTRERGPKVRTGLCVAVEPMVTSGGAETRELDDGWTVVTLDGGRAAHFEQTVAVLDDGLWVLTAPDGGAERLAALGVPLASAAR